MSKIFGEFKSGDDAEWVAALVKELKGKDFREVLVKESEEGIEIQPFYSSCNNYQTNGSAFPFRRGNSSREETEIIQQINIQSDYKLANQVALKALAGGATSLFFHGEILNAEQFEQLFLEIGIEYIEIGFKTTGDYLNLLQLLENYCDKKQLNKKKIRCYFHSDPLGDFAINGGWKKSEDEDLAELIVLMNTGKNKFGSFRPLGIDATLFHNAGATTQQEISYTLAKGSEYLNVLTESGISVDEACSMLQFHFSCGTDFFFSLAKFRAFRVLWANLVKAWNPDHEHSCNTFLRAENSLLFTSHSDIYSNLLRSTTEAFSAVCGGVDSLYIYGYNEAVADSDDFSRRMAQNIQLILREESNLYSVQDPIGGSYFVEYLTDQLMEKSWEAFCACEKSGGFLDQLFKGKIQQQIRKSASAKIGALSTKELKMVGVNVYVNKSESIQRPKEFSLATHPGEAEAILPLRLSSTQKIMQA